MADQPTIDTARLDEDLRAVCARHGIRLPDGETVHAWAALIEIDGHHPDGREYRRVDCLVSDGLDRCDLDRLLLGAPAEVRLRPTG